MPHEGARNATDREGIYARVCSDCARFNGRGRRVRADQAGGLTGRNVPRSKPLGHDPLRAQLAGKGRSRCRFNRTPAGFWSARGACRCRQLKEVETNRDAARASAGTPRTHGSVEHAERTCLAD
jgi:hypothetical protein